MQDYSLFGHFAKEPIVQCDPLIQYRWFAVRIDQPGGAVSAELNTNGLC